MHPNTAFLTNDEREINQNIKSTTNMNLCKRKRKSTLLAILSLVIASAFVMTSCEEGYTLGKEDPDWLGSSIYDYLKSNGNYTNTVRLIDDLGYAPVLSKTGSKTLFVADDNAYARFFKQNKWGVSSYEGLTLAQKKLLLYGSMINNSCQVAYLSSSEGPTEGDCMRRLTSQSEYDSIPLVAPSAMPETPYWQYYRDQNKTIPVMMDATTPPMIHFIEMFLNNQLITNDDVDFLFNFKRDRKPGDADVNGIIMEEQNIKCSNGFIHKMAEVVTPLQNMAELIRTTKNSQGYSKLLDRYCAPYYAGDVVTREYNRLYGTNVDSVFQKSYFSQRSQGGTALVLTPQEGPVNGTLKFDPGWNQFYSQTNAGIATNVALQENMGVMIVPSDEALERYWHEGAGKALKDRYGSWENVPDGVIEKMLNVSMLNSFVNSVPSKFNTVLNDANDELGIKVEDVDSVAIACNGAVYFTNKVFNPVAYISVSFPALVNEETMGIIYWGIEQLGYEVYLNSQNSFYSFFIPSNNALLEYIDPCSFGKANTQLFRFHLKPEAQTEREKVWASIWNYNVETGEVTDSISEASYNQIINRLEDILNTHIIIGDVEDGNTYYKTKGGGMIKVNNASARDKGMTVEGSDQKAKGTVVPVSNFFDESVEGNGRTYVLDAEPMLSTRKTVADILSEHEEFSAFYNLMQGSSFFETTHVIGTDRHACGGTNINLFNTFNYSVFVPTNDAIQKLIAEGKLPTWEQVDEEEDEELADSLTHVIEKFIRYHIMDNSVLIGMGADNANYETAAYEVLEDNLSYHKLDVTYDNSGISIVDEAGVKHSVQTAGGLYNLMAREYQYDSASAPSAQNIYTSSYAVVHQIDGALDYHK
jgi:uncharacterized surface protein with fasciclin (FAS1) repeats